MVFDKAKAEINPLARTTGKNAPPLGPLCEGAARRKKRRGGFHIRPCLLAARQPSAGAYRMRPYGFRFRPKGENSTRGSALSWPPLRGGSARRRWGREPCGGQEYFGLRLSKNICRGEHCSPVPACLIRELSRKMRCGGKLTGDQWSPLRTQQGKTCPSPPPQKT